MLHNCLYSGLQVRFRNRACCGRTRTPTSKRRYGNRKHSILAPGCAALVTSARESTGQAKSSRDYRREPAAGNHHFVPVVAETTAISETTLPGFSLVDGWNQARRI